MTINPIIIPFHHPIIIILRPSPYGSLHSGGGGMTYYNTNNHQSSSHNHCNFALWLTLIIILTTATTTTHNYDYFASRLTLYPSSFIIIFTTAAIIQSEP